MPNYQVVRCANDDCAKFQSQQEKKTGKWACVVCGLKQSLKRVYFQSNAPKECRSMVMELNMKRGQAESAKLSHASLVEQSSQSHDEEPSVNIRTGKQVSAGNVGDVEGNANSESRWATYEDTAEESGVRLEDDTHDLDEFNRVIVGRAEPSDVNRQVATNTKQRKPPAPRVQPRIASATLASTRPQQQLPSVRHMPYKRPDPQVDTQTKERPTFSQALASLTQSGSVANPSAATTTSSNCPSEVVTSGSRAVQSGKVDTQDMTEYTSASKWSQFNRNDSDDDSNDSDEDS
ncbi:hypothetical protein FBU31_002657 [Coemansia sp. 'formosensis']|nr:hypothetical protein FBU31_002657 [Coemansia sp. 'formosensis']